MPNRDYYLPQRGLTSQNDAARIEAANVPRSVFKGSFNHITAFNVGNLIPFLCEEILPGDHMSYDVWAYARLSTPLFPMFMNMRLDTFFFFCPSRILWKNFVKQMGEQVNPTDTISYVTPQITSPASGYAVGSLYDYFGLPTVGQLGVGATISTISLPFRAYNAIYNYWFRDENLINSAADNSASDGPDNNADYVVRNRAKSHDYFTDALPWPQKFTPPSTPLSGLAPVIGIGAIGGTSSAGPITARETGGLDTSYANYKRADTAAHNVVMKVSPASPDSYPQVYADLSAATGVAINTFRQAFMVQTLLERDARGGTRYGELVYSHFRVQNPDARLQWPEYIGGGQTPLNLTPIAQTAPTAGVPLGALGAAGTAAGKHRATYAATEHGYIIGIINCKKEIAYQQGIHRMWFRNTRYDYYWPAFAGLGEQSILKREIFADGSATDIDVFGYQERWHEYRTNYSRISGIFRSTAAGTIDQWHLAERFLTVPALNQTFIEDTPNVLDRVLAAGSAARTGNQQILADIHIQRIAVRQIPTYGTPAILGRF